MLCRQFDPPCSPDAGWDTTPGAANPNPNPNLNPNPNPNPNFNPSPSPNPRRRLAYNAKWSKSYI